MRRSCAFGGRGDGIDRFFQHGTRVVARRLFIFIHSIDGEKVGVLFYVEREGGGVRGAGIFAICVHLPVTSRGFYRAFHGKRGTRCTVLCLSHSVKPNLSLTLRLFPIGAWQDLYTLRVVLFFCVKGGGIPGQPRPWLALLFCPATFVGCYVIFWLVNFASELVAKSVFCVFGGGKDQGLGAAVDEFPRTIIVCGRCAQV